MRFYVVVCFFRFGEGLRLSTGFSGAGLHGSWRVSVVRVLKFGRHPVLFRSSAVPGLLWFRFQGGEDFEVVWVFCFGAEFGLCGVSDRVGTHGLLRVWEWFKVFGLGVVQAVQVWLSGCSKFSVFRVLSGSCLLGRPGFQAFTRFLKRKSALAKSTSNAPGIAVFAPVCGQMPYHYPRDLSTELVNKPAENNVKLNTRTKSSVR